MNCVTRCEKIGPQWWEARVLQIVMTPHAETVEIRCQIPGAGVSQWTSSKYSFSSRLKSYRERQWADKMPDSGGRAGGDPVSHWTRLESCCCCISLEVGTRVIGALFLISTLGNTPAQIVQTMPSNFCYSFKIVETVMLFKLCWIGSYSYLLGHKKFKQTKICFHLKTTQTSLFWVAPVCLTKYSLECFSENQLKCFLWLINSHFLPTFVTLWSWYSAPLMCAVSRNIALLFAIINSFICYFWPQEQYRERLIKFLSNYWYESIQQE